jgi:hypothetical protein
MSETSLREEIDRVVKANEETQEKLEKVMQSKINKAYVLLVRLLSLAILVSTVYAALYVSAGSAAVLGTLFLITWGMYLSAFIAIGIVKGLAKYKSQELESEYSKLRRKNIV